MVDIKLIIFDLDGVLIDAKEIHYEALNRALSSIDDKYVISKEEHLLVYDGLPTKDKLELLTSNKDLPIDSHKEVWKKKQEYTIDVIKDFVTYDKQKVDMMKQLKDDGYMIYVASNSIRPSLQTMLYLSLIHI